MTIGRQIWWVPLGALLAAAWVLVHLDTPLVEDSLFWWIPKGIKAGEAGFPLSPAGDLPAAMGAASARLPQWSGGLPDYGHPPLWYWWIGLWTQAGATLTHIRLATLLPAMAAGAGFVALGQRLGSVAAGFAVFATPPFLAQLVRPELDLALLAIVPWALVALLNRAWWRFSVLSTLAVWCKEPGVLLVVPALVVAFEERRWRIGALSPLLALGLWAGVHGWMAVPERLPTDIFGLGRDMLTVLFIVFVAQGRFLLFAGIPGLRRERALISFVVVWLLFFSVVGFFANRGTADLYTHIRYLVPGMAVAVVLLARSTPMLAAAGLLWIHTASPFGPEASMFGTDQALAERQAAPWIADKISQGHTVWVGTHQAARLLTPFAGVVERPIPGIRIYSMSTDPSALNADDIVLETTYGEPAGRLLTGTPKTAMQGWRVHDASVTAWKVAP
jgi:hypothetical protein